MIDTITFDELIADPDLAQPFVITRALRARDLSGQDWEQANTTINAFGIVQPSPVETTAIYTPEGERTNTTCIVWTTYPLQCGIDGQAEDQITYNGQNYRVHEVTQWTHAGVFYKATCTQVPQ